MVQLTSRLAPHPKEEPQINIAITNVSKLKQTTSVAQDISRENQDLFESIKGRNGAPLDTVSGFARAILEHHAAELSEQVKGMVERMECAAVRMEVTFRNLIEYCMGHDEVVLDPVSLDELMQHVMMEQRAIIQRRNAEITVQRPLPCVRGARLVLGHVLSAIISNTLRTQPNDTPRICITAEQQGREVVLTVRDEGTRCKVPPGEQNFRMFEHSNSAAYFSGSEVGLSIIGRTIERMNGRVWVEGDVGQPTLLHIGLPSV
jgi:light-regulated signal transduction histidine kinase (bacteriophytochrome)